MTSIVPFISNAVFESSDIQLMSDAYDKVIAEVYRFGHPNRIVREIIASRIIALTIGGERDVIQLREGALAACGFNGIAAGITGRSNADG